MTDLDKRIYRAAARAAVTTGVPIMTHLAFDAETAIAIFHEEGLPLDRVLFGHVDDSVSAGKVRDTWIADQGGRLGFDTWGYDTELEDPPFWARPRAGTARALPPAPQAGVPGPRPRCRPTPTAARSAGRE